MRKKIISAMLALCMAGSLLTGCGTSADAEKKSKDSGDVTTVKWFTSRPVDGAIDQVMHEIADEYSEKMGGIIFAETENIDCGWKYAGYH